MPKWPPLILIGILSALAASGSFLIAAAHVPQKQSIHRGVLKTDPTTIEGHTSGWISVLDQKTKKKFCLNANHIESFYESGKDLVTIRTPFRQIVVKISYDDLIKFIDGTIKDGYW